MKSESLPEFAAATSQSGNLIGDPSNRLETKKMGTTTLNIMTHGKMTFSITTLFIKGLFATFSINGTQHNNTIIMLRVLIMSRHERYQLTGTCLNGNSDGNGNYHC
jgi:hypothetical protein